MGIVRDLWTRVTIGASPVNVATAAPVRVQQQLEGAVTMVAEVSLAGITPALVTNDPVTIHHVNRNHAPDPNYDARQLFTGVVNRITGVGTPHGATVSCTGELAKLRRTRTGDYSLRGKTDTEVVRAVLTYCGITYTSGDIHGWGYELGRDQPDADMDEIAPTWRAGQSGAALIAELDRVFACATIELGDGRIVRFPYSKAPSEYVSPTFAKQFVRGQPGVAFYGSERDRGDIDQIANHWVVRGLSWTGAEGSDHEGCQFQYQATGDADHAKLGAGVVVGPQEFSSDLIDSEELAKAVAVRLMHWNNREPDTCRIVCGNDARVAPGQLITVKDPSYGIDNAVVRRYLVTAVTRDGDTMTLDGTGGAAGATGTVRGSLVRKCNETETDVGTDPGAFDAPDPMIPDVPGLDDVPPDLPEVEVPTPPRTADSIFHCTSATGGIASPDWHGAFPWRAVGNWGTTVNPETFENETIELWQNTGTLIYNTEPIVADQTIATDHLFGKNELVYASGYVTINYPDTQWQVTLLGRGGTDLGNLSASFYTEPGYHTAEQTPPFSPATHPGGDWGLHVRTENSGPGLPGIPAGYIDEDSGGLRGAPIPAGTRIPFGVAFNPSTEYQTIQVYGETTTFKFDPTVRIAPGPGDLHYADCDHDHHILQLRAVSLTATPPPEGWTAKPLVVIDDLELGLDTCEINPDYIPPVVGGAEDF